MPVTIHLKRNGPLLIEAPDVAEVRVVDADGRDITLAAARGADDPGGASRAAP